MFRPLSWCALFVLASGLLAAGIVGLAYVHPWAGFQPRRESSEVVRRLESLGDSALASRDVPVAAVLLYAGAEVGAGFNTVVRHGNAGGHAEINAISSALRHIGERRFARMNRDSLVLVTTFEPCAMCRGALVHYGIRNVRILKRKPAVELIGEDLRVLRYYWRRTFSGPTSLQDTLFRRHPHYHGE